MIRTSKTKKTLFIYNKSNLTKTDVMESFALKNITNGISKPWIWSFLPLAFSDEDFAPIDIFNESSLNFKMQTKKFKTIEKKKMNGRQLTLRPQLLFHLQMFQHNLPILAAVKYFPSNLKRNLYYYVCTKFVLQKKLYLLLLYI